MAVHYEEGLDLWDVCAASLIVREAGGEVWDARGEPLRLQGFDGFVHAANSAALGQRVRELVLGGESAACAQRVRWAVGAMALLGVGFMAGVCAGRR